MCSCFSIGYCLDNNCMYHMTKCNLLLFVEAGIIILMLAYLLQSLNVTYSLSTGTWICI